MERDIKHADDPYITAEVITVCVCVCVCVHQSEHTLLSQHSVIVWERTSPAAVNSALMHVMRAESVPEHITSTLTALTASDHHQSICLHLLRQEHNAKLPLRSKTAFTASQTHFNNSRSEL